MAKRPKRRLRPIADLSKRQQSERRFARKAGFKDEYALRRWKKKHTELPDSDPRHLRFNTRKAEDKILEIKRVKKVTARTRTPSKAIKFKYDLLVKNKAKMSPWLFEQKYRDSINQLLKDVDTTKYDKQILRQMLKDMKEGQHVPEALLPGKQGELF